MGQLVEILRLDLRSYRWPSDPSFTSAPLDRGFLLDALASVRSSRTTEGSNKLEHVCRMIYAGVPSFFGLGLEDNHVETFWLLCNE